MVRRRVARTRVPPRPSSSTAAAAYGMGSNPVEARPPGTPGAPSAAKLHDPDLVTDGPLPDFPRDAVTVAVLLPDADVLLLPFQEAEVSCFSLYGRPGPLSALASFTDWMNTVPLPVLVTVT